MPQPRRARLLPQPSALANVLAHQAAPPPDRGRRTQGCERLITVVRPG
jgi:hypothetical protein